LEPACFSFLTPPAWFLTRCLHLKQESKNYEELKNLPPLLTDISMVFPYLLPARSLYKEKTCGIIKKTTTSSYTLLSLGLRGGNISHNPLNLRIAILLQKIKF